MSHHLLRFLSKSTIRESVTEGPEGALKGRWIERDTEPIQRNLAVIDL